MLVIGIIFDVLAVIGFILMVSVSCSAGVFQYKYLYTTDQCMEFIYKSICQAIYFFVHLFVHPSINPK